MLLISARFVDDNKFPLLTGKGGYFHLWTDDPHFDPSIPSADGIAAGY